MAGESTPLHVPKRRLLGMVALAFGVASVLVVCFVLPAEYHFDRTGVGRLTGVSRLAGPIKLNARAAVVTPATPGTAAGAVRYYESGYRADFVDIPLPSPDSGRAGSELEYKVRMQAGGTLTYAWSVAGIRNPEEFYYDFHGEAPAQRPGDEPTVTEYRQATGSHSSGSLVAPRDGIFGWYVQNQSAQPVVMHLRLSGFYELVPPGEPGNEAGIKANEALPP